MTEAGSGSAGRVRSWRSTRCCGIETEYGIVLRGAGESNPVTASSLLINAYVSDLPSARPPPGRKVGLGLRGRVAGQRRPGRRRRAGAMPPEVETHLVNAVLTNGARYYVDHAHPELSTPECADARSVVVCDRAGRADPAAVDGGGRAASLPDGQEIVVYKNNSDGKGNSLRLPRELPDGPGGAVRPDRHPRHRPLRHPPDLHRRRQGRHRGAGARSTRCRSSSPSGPTSSRRRSASRPR